VRAVFSVVKAIVNNYLASTMSGARSTELQILSNGRKLADKIDFDDVISDLMYYSKSAK